MLHGSLFSGSDTLAIASVLECHTVLAELRKREATANEALAKNEHDEEAAKDLAAVFEKLEEIGADTAISKAATILSGTEPVQLCLAILIAC